jgi:Protein of unknown function (DUF2795)
MSMMDYGDRSTAGTWPGWRRAYSRISWGAVFAGAVVAAATMLLLSLLGVGFGASALRLSAVGAEDLSNYGLGAGIWTAVNLILSMLFGGYVGARLSGTHSHLDGELHGITVWAVGTLMATYLLGQLASLAVGTVTTATGVAATGSGGLTQQVSPQSLADRLQQSLTLSNNPTQMTRDQIRSEIGALTGRLLLNGSLTDQDQNRLTALVAADANVTPEEAARRVAQMEQNATTARAQARSAADTAAAGAALGARAIFSALLLGLGAAMLGAWFGTRHARVLAPLHEPVYETHPATYATHPATYTTHPAYEPVAAPASVHVLDDGSRPVPAYLREVTFPASKQDLLRVARARNEEPITLRRLEQIPDRSYASVNDLMSALLATV